MKNGDISSAMNIHPFILPSMIPTLF